MGVHGLTTFVAGYREKYKESIHIRDSPVIIDGCNLMYFLYFDGKYAVVEKGPKKQGEGSSSSSSSSKAVPHAYLFGGDWERYAQNVRYFFQQLKQCNIIPIVLLDGAYDKSKLEVAKARFAKSVADNVKCTRDKDGTPVPGKSYTPIFLKTVFLEVLDEQKIAHYQTIGEADNTIAFISRLLRGCPILSSDSDFLIYINVKAIPLASLKFGKAKPNKHYRQAKMLANDEVIPEKIWTLQAEYVSLPKLCREEFKISDPRMLGLAAIILGNDKVPSRIFKNFQNIGNHGDWKQRIVHVMLWLTSQQSLQAGMRNMLDFISPEQRKGVEQAMCFSLIDYIGDGGEYQIWQYLKHDMDVRPWIDEDLVNRLEFVKRFANLSLATNDTEPAKDGIMNILGLKLLTESEDENSQDYSLINNFNIYQLPQWYVHFHLHAKVQSYHLNMLTNHVVFLTPQIEMYKEPSSHEMSIPIIQVIAGILHDIPDQKIEIISHHKGRVRTISALPITAIPDFGILPILADNLNAPTGRKELAEVTKYEERVSIMMACLGFHNNTALCKFVESWPGSFRIWILTLLYFVEMELQAIQANKTDSTTHECVAVTIAIFLDIIKNLIVCSGNTLKNNACNPCIESINELYKASFRSEVKQLAFRRFYQDYGTFEYSRRGKNFLKCYDIRIAHALSKYLCILYHTEMLNNLLSNPFKSPKIRYTLNNYFIYKLADKICYSKNRVSDIKNAKQFRELLKETFEIVEIRAVVADFLTAIL